MVDKFSKMTSFIACNKTDDTKQGYNLFFTGIVRLHGILRFIISDRDVKFLSQFGKYSRLNWVPNCCFQLFVILWIEVVNRTLGGLSRSIIAKNIKSLDECLPFLEFA